jgi:hypothetical protein
LIYRLRTAIFLVCCVSALVYGGFELSSKRAIARAPGVLVKDAPVQQLIEGRATIEKNGYTLQPLARYDITARVLARESYRWDRGAELAPIDLAVGWGPMSDSAVLDKLRISQDNRWYQWRADTYPIAAAEMVRSSSNMHLIAADKEIERDLRRVRPGAVVRMKGYLVEARGKDGFTWRSSLSREDTGNGACELMWVASFSVQ